MEMCARCHKRIAVVYVTKIENGQTVTEGICLKCAKELGIKPVNDILDKMGVSPEDIDEISDNLATDMIPGQDNGPDQGDNGGAPAIDIGKLFSNMNFAGGQQSDHTEKPKTEKKAQEKNSKLK